MLTLDKNTVSEFESAWIEKLKVFFIEAGCSGTKIQMETDFEVTDELCIVTARNKSDVAVSQERKIASFHSQWPYNFDVYIPKSDITHLENASITRVVKADHTGIAKTRYIFASDEVEDRCGCVTSFAFEKPVPKIDLEKLKKMRENFKKNNT